ncbi:hypothetical protein BJY04DRAFT_231142 [Aspergillus karnatakaensis]|uniref:MFS transporter/fungal specific transcription factor domain-containing protein n=1 Tax=Aspergillus karnatakaensis TaxID=1810916 RepID=UPI003CCC9D51
MSAQSTPSKRPQACERCWKRKQKARCIPRQFRVQPSAAESGLSHAALPSYVDSLKQTLQALEALSVRKRRRAAPEDPAPDETPTAFLESQSGLDSSVQAAMGEIGFLSRSAMAEPRDDNGGFPRQLSTSQMLQAILSLGGGSPSRSTMTEEESSHWNMLALKDPLQAMNKEVAAPFIRHFLDHVGISYVRFDRKELKEQCEAFFSSDRPASGGEIDPVQCNREVSVYLAIAIGMLVSPQSSRVEVVAQGLHSAAVKLLPRMLQGGNCTDLIHCLLLLTIFSMLSPTGGSCWHLLGLAMKKCVAFRLHRAPDPGSTLSTDEVVKRTSLFWSMYIIDRALCTVMDRPFAIQDEDISLPMPTEPARDDSAEHAFGFHMVMYAQLTSSIRDDTNRCPLFHYRNLCFWRDTPHELRAYVESNPVARTHLRRLSCRALVQLLILQITARYSYPVSDSTILEISQDVRSSCEGMIDQMYRGLDRPSSLASFIDGYDIFAAGVAIIYGSALSTTDRMLADANTINKCTALLTALGERFSGVRVFRKVLLAISDIGLGREPDDIGPTAATLASTNKRTVYLLDTLHPDAVEHAKTLWNVVLPGDKELNNWRENASAVIVRSSYVTADDISRAPKLIAIGKHGVGIDKIDQAACAKRDIKILNTPGANARDVAELVVALTMTVARGIRSITTRQLTAPVPKETCTGLTLQDKTVGVIGMGNIGRTVAEIFHGGFSAKLIGFDAFMPDNAWAHLPHRRAQSIDEILEEADVITLHIPLTEETRNLISYKQLRQMKPDTILINAARGGIVNEDDLTRVLSDGHLWGAGLDCHEQEPPSVERYGKLWENLNVVSTPHIGAATNTAQRASSMAALISLLSLHPLHLQPLHPPTMPLNALHIPLHTIRNEKRLPLTPSKTTIRQILPSLLGSNNPRFRNPFLLSGWSETVDGPRWVGEACLALVREIIGAFESFEVAAVFRASPFGSPSQRTTSVTLPSGVVIGPSRKMSEGGDADPPRHSVGWPVQRRASGMRRWILARMMGLIADTRKAFRDAPKGIFNAYVFSVTWVFALAGVAKGFDEGLKFGVYDQSADEYAGTKGWIVSIATAGAVFGCLGSLPISDRLGRRWTLRLGTIVYIAGVLGQGLCDGNLGGLYASRIITGMGIGVTTIVPPVYISEIAPKAIRGLLTLQYAACQQLGVVLGFFINYGVTKQYAGSDTQWMLPTLLQLLPAALWGIGTFLCPESPRWLLFVGRREESATNLSKLRHLPIEHPVVAAELDGMDAQILHEHESVASASQWQLLKETLIPVQNRRRFFLLFMATLFSQWSGANAITQYSPTIFGYLGIVGDEATFLATGIYGVVKFVSTLIFAVVIVDFVGRRRSLLTGITLQILTLAFVGAYLGATKNMTTDEITASPNAERASTAAIVAIYLHAVAWSIGWFSIPYLIGPEIFPTRIRSLNMSISMALHWAFYFGCSKAMPSLLAATHRWGAFLFFGVICLVGLVYVFFAMPDTTGRSLEALDQLFDRPWYTVYQVAYASKDDIKIESSGKGVVTKEGEQERSEHLESAKGELRAGGGLALRWPDSAEVDSDHII